jgi:hypothetical protein
VPAGTGLTLTEAEKALRPLKKALEAGLRGMEACSLVPAHRACSHARQLAADMIRVCALLGYLLIADLSRDLQCKTQIKGRGFQAAAAASRAGVTCPCTFGNSSTSRGRISEREKNSSPPACCPYCDLTCFLPSDFLQLETMSAVTYSAACVQQKCSRWQTSTARRSRLLPAGLPAPRPALSVSRPPDRAASQNCGGQPSLRHLLQGKP